MEKVQSSPWSATHITTCPSAAQTSWDTSPTKPASLAIVRLKAHWRLAFRFNLFFYLVRLIYLNSPTPSCYPQVTAISQKLASEGFSCEESHDPGRFLFDN